MRFSRTCRQRELRPDLAVTSITVSPDPANPNRDEYSAVIANLGNSSAGPFDVLFATLDGSTKPIDQTITRLKAHASITDTFSGPAVHGGERPDDHSRLSQPGRRSQPGQQLDDSRLSGPGDGLSGGPGPARLIGTMKTEIHPNYVDAHVRCTCGNEFMTRSTQPEIHVEICSACHPFYTGRQKLVDTGGRVERFQRRVAKGRRNARTTAGS